MKYKCPKCSEIFSSRRAFERHRKETRHYNHKSQSRKLTEEEKIVFRKKCLDTWIKNGHWSTGKASTPEKELERRKKISESMRKYGGKRKHSGRGKKGTYKGYYCDSSWELAYVIYNIEHNIKFYRYDGYFEYEWDNQKLKYYPDFMLEDGTLIEIKGYETDQWLAKLASVPKNFKIIVLTKEDIKPYIKYVTDKYGKNYINLYDNKITL